MGDGRRFAHAKKNYIRAKQEKVKLLTQVKGNHPKLYEDCVQITKETPPSSQIETSSPADVSRLTKGMQKETTEKGHGRIEMRRVSVYHTKPEAFRDKVWGKLLTAVICVYRKRTIYNAKNKKWESVEEKSFYIANSDLDAEKAYALIRRHWHIENKHNYVRDVVLKEDASRIRTRPGVFAVLRSFALNVFACNNVSEIKAEMEKNRAQLLNILSYKHCA